MLWRGLLIFNYCHNLYRTLMKNILLTLFLIISLQTFAQKTYYIEKCIWNYTQPSEYIFKVDNFEKERKTGEDYIKKQENGTTLSTDDKILFSLAKTESSQVNVILASYKDNENIEKYTLKGYAEMLGEYFKANPKDNNSNNIITVEVSELIIDERKFFLISKKTELTEQNYSYTSNYFVAEIEGKEFSIVAIYDNEQDKKKIEKSILESTFE